MPTRDLFDTLESRLLLSGLPSIDVSQPPALVYALGAVNYHWSAGNSVGTLETPLDLLPVAIAATPEFNGFDGVFVYLNVDINADGSLPGPHNPLNYPPLASNSFPDPTGPELQIYGVSGSDITLLVTGQINKFESQYNPLQSTDSVFQFQFTPIQSGGAVGSINGSYSADIGMTMIFTAFSGEPTFDGNFTHDFTEGAEGGIGSLPPDVGSSAVVLNTTPSPLPVSLNSNAPIVLQDTALLAGGNNPTGSITFNLSRNGTVIDTEVVLVNGAGNYTTPGYTLPTTGNVTGSYQWDAYYSGDLNGNIPTVDVNNSDEQFTINPLSPTITTVPSATTISLNTGSQTIKDSATLSGTYYGTGNITFTLVAPDGVTVLDTEVVPVNGNGNYSTPNGYTLPAGGNLTGTYQWNAVYTGDGNNLAASDLNDSAERFTVSAASQALNTVPGAAVTVGSGTKLSDSATLSGGYSPTGTLTFTLFDAASNAVYTNVVTVSGNGDYTTASGTNPGGYLPLGTGTYQWVVNYSGDGNNLTALSGWGSEPETVNTTNPTINTVAGGAVVIGSGIKLTDTAVLGGGFNPTGSITFTLYSPTHVALYTTVVPVNGNGTYTTAAGSNPGGFPPTTTGDYLWTATYSGDTNNAGATDNGVNESETVKPTQPSLITTASFSAGSVVGAAIPQDSAILSGGYSPGGALTFTLKDPYGTAVDTETITATGNGTYTTSNIHVATKVGTYTWTVSYSGDALNLSAPDQGGPAEQVTTTKASPSIVTNATQNSGGVVGTALMADTSTISGGFSVSGTITFKLTTPSGTVSTVGTVNVSGNGNYFSPTVPVTEVGTYVWSATFSGDGLNNGAIDNGVNESLTTIKASPAIVTNATQNFAGVVGSALMADTATITGGYKVDGTVAFTLTTPSGSILNVGTVSISGAGSYSSPTVLATEVGTYTWHASYSGNGLNNGAIDNGVNESLTTIKASPSIVTNATQNSGGVVGSALLADTATISGGYKVDGIITFTLTTPSGSVLNVGTVSVNGAGSYNSLAVLATQVGTYTWHASYSGNGLNNGAIDNGVNESLTTIKASPSVVTNATQNSNGVVGSALLADTATISGGYSVSGTITFKLKSPSGNVTTVGTVNVSGNGNYFSPTVPATEVGTYVWSATFSGDGLNNGAIDNGVNESLTTVKASPSIVTTASLASGNVVGTAIPQDKAVVANGYNLSGNLVFTLKDPNGGVVDTETVALSGNSTYQTSHLNVATLVGIYSWAVSYAGNSFNFSAVDQGGAAEQMTIIKATPNLITTPSITTNTVNQVCAGQFGTIGFWQNCNGQQVITSFNGSPSQTLLAGWMATNFPHLFGASNPYVSSTLSSYGKTSFNGLTNAQIAQVYANVWPPSGLQKNTYTQAFAVALGLYADTASLGGQSLIAAGLAAKYGFVVTSAGAGLFNVGTNGAAFGVANNSLVTVMQIMQTVDANFVSSTGLFFGGDSTKTGAANNVLNGINTVGDIPGTGCGCVQVNDGSRITDAATLTNGYNLTGTITFKLYAPDNVTVVDTESVTVNGNGTYYTPVGFTATVPGTYQWVATYSGDGKNNSVAGAFGDEPVTVGGSPFSISGKKYNDINGNDASAGIGSDDVGLGGVTINLYFNGGTAPAMTTTTAADGSYSFNNLSPGTYVVKEAVPGGWTQTYGNAGYTINASGGTNYTAKNFADFNNICISGLKYKDSNGNGCQDTGELGIQGWVMDLFNSGGTLIATATTDANGNYAFTNVGPGSYTVKEENQAGWVRTSIPASYAVAATSGNNVSGLVFGNFQMDDCFSHISCVSYVINGCTTVTDLTGNVHQGDTVKVIFTLDATETFSLVSYTAPDNYFVAANAWQQQIFDVASATFGVGTHSLTVVVPDCDYQIDFVCGAPIGTFGPAGSNIFYTPQGRLYDADNGGTCAPTTFYSNCSGNSSIAGTVFSDLNNNGIKNTGEPGIANVKVMLTGTTSTGQKVKVLLFSDASGNFKFNFLKVGTYKISEGSFDDYFDGKDTVGSTGGSVTNDVIANVTLATGEAATGYNFADLNDCSISGRVFKDTDKDGIIDSGELGLANVKIVLTGTDDLGQAVYMVTYTDINGVFRFDDLRAGTYKLVETTPTGYVTTKDIAGTAGGAVSGDTISNIVLAWGVDASNYNFGETK